MIGTFCRIQWSETHHVTRRYFSTGILLSRQVKVRDQQRIPVGAPKKRLNPFLQLYDKKGRPVERQKWNWMGYKNIPFYNRDVHEFGLNPKDVHPTNWGGNMELVARIGKDQARFGYQPGYTDKTGKFVVVPQMIPEFIVPDLTDFELRPYVPYQIRDVHQSEFTAQDLFKATYGQELVNNGQKMTHVELDEYHDKFLQAESKSLQERKMSDKNDTIASEKPDIS